MNNYFLCYTESGDRPTVNEMILNAAEVGSVDLESYYHIEWVDKELRVDNLLESMESPLFYKNDYATLFSSIMDIVDQFPSFRNSLLIVSAPGFVLSLKTLNWETNAHIFIL